jgi:RNA polymerase sigma-B factor
MSGARTVAGTRIPRPAPAYAEQAPTAELLGRLAGCQRGDGRWTALRDEVVRRHLSLVRALAWRFRDRGEDLEDLVQVATVGLLNAMDRFDPGHGAEFTTFATPTIVGELKRHLRDRAGAVRVPRRLQERSAAVSRASVLLYQRLRRSPTVAELAAEVGASDEEVLEALECSRACNTVPLDGGGAAPAALDTADALDGVEYRAALRPLLDGLTDRDKLIILRRFFEHRTQSEIATELGISQVQVSRLLTRTLAYLRARLGE